MKNIYLDYNATTPIHPEVKEAIIESFDLYGNPSSLHTPGRAASGRITEARENIAKLINADPEEIIFTSCGTESDNSATNTGRYYMGKNMEGNTFREIGCKLGVCK